jgi:hypothetical protein
MALALLWMALDAFAENPVKFNKTNSLYRLRARHRSFFRQTTPTSLV